MKRFDAIEKQAQELANSIRQLRAEIRAEGYQLTPLNLDRALAGAHEAIKWTVKASEQRAADLAAGEQLKVMGAAFELIEEGVRR